MIVFGSPRRYIQGPGAVHAVGPEIARLGRSAAVIGDPQVLSLVGEPIRASAAQAGIGCRLLAFGGEVTPEEIARLTELCRDGEVPQVIVAAGGGKGIDTGKAVSMRLGARLVTLPTVASNDSSTSHVIVLYDGNHRLTGVDRLPANPDVVVADTAIIARAPRQLLLAGIGDAVAKRFEAKACADAGGTNMFGGTPPAMALAIAEACYATLMQHAAAALAATDRQEPDAALERIVEACLLMSGLAFESGGLSIAHAMTRGLTSVEPIARSLHGLQVAYGTLVQLALDPARAAEFQALHAFYGRIGLPRSLSELGMAEAGHNVLVSIARPTVAAPHTRNFHRTVTEDSLVEAMREVERLAGARQAAAPIAALP